MGNVIEGEERGGEEDKGIDGGQGVDRKPMDILAKWFLNEHRRDQFFTLVNDGEVTWFKQEVTMS